MVKYYYPIIVLEAASLTADLLTHIANNWIFHATLSGYMDHNGWYKTINLFTQQFGNNTTNKQIFHFYGHDSHFSFILMAIKNVQPFNFKSGDSPNDQPNDNDPNTKIKACYNRALTEWKERDVSFNLSKHI